MITYQFNLLTTILRVKNESVRMCGFVSEREFPESKPDLGEVVNSKVSTVTDVLRLRTSVF